MPAGSRRSASISCAIAEIACAAAESGRAETTPAERASHARIGRVYVAIAGPPVSVTAVAFLELGPGQPSQLSATLEPAGRTWRVVAVGS